MLDGAPLVVDVLVTAALLAALSIPLAISAWAFLDAARRPAWVWAFSKRRQVVWLALTAAGVVTVLGGLVISGWYLVKVRPVLAAIEAGDLTKSP